MSVLNVTVEQGFVGLTSGSSTALVQDKTMITIDKVKKKVFSWFNFIGITMSFKRGLLLKG